MGDDPRSRDDADDTLVPYHEVHPKEQWQTEIAQATAALAARDTSCPSCRHAARAPAGEQLVRAGVSREPGRRQPRCGRPSAIKELNAPIFMAAEWPRRLLARKAPYGLHMSGKTEAEMAQVLRK